MNHPFVKIVFLLLFYLIFVGGYAQFASLGQPIIKSVSYPVIESTDRSLTKAINESFEDFNYNAPKPWPALIVVFPDTLQKSVPLTITIRESVEVNYFFSINENHDDVSKNCIGMYTFPYKDRIIKVYIVGNAAKKFFKLKDDESITYEYDANFQMVGEPLAAEVKYLNGKWLIMRYFYE